MEKIIGQDKSEKFVTSTVITATTKRSPQVLDEAWEFFHAHHDPHNVYDAAALKRLRRKIDMRIVPILYCIFELQFLDKYLLNYAIIMGLPEDLDLKVNQLNNIASSLWIAYLVATVPSGFAFNKVPVAKWLGVMMTLWGVTIACIAAAQSYNALLAIRVLMGVFDASIPPCLMLISSQYYRKDEQATIFAWWFSSVGTSMIIGGLVSYGFQFIEIRLFRRGVGIMYLVLGLISLATGIWSLLYLPDTPMNAKFLTNEEKAAIIQHVSINGTGVHNTEMKLSHHVDLATDPQVYLLMLTVVVASCGSGIIGTYGASLIKGFGYDSKQSALLNTPVGTFGMVMTLAVAYAIRYNLIQKWSTFRLLAWDCLLSRRETTSTLNSPASTSLAVRSQLPG